ncbi:hypothetical protein [Cellulomonas sp. P5_C5]
MRELDDLMNEAADVAELSLGGRAPSASVRAATVRRVRRRHAVRHTVQSAGVLVIGAVVAGASWFGLQHDDEPRPAVTTTQSPSPTPTPVPSPSPTPTPPAVADDILGLPPTYALPAGLLEQTTPGWVLSVYRSTAAADPDVVVAHTVVLSSPAGELYRVVDLPADAEVELLAWEAGTTSAVVRLESTTTSADSPRAILDLTTGAISDDTRGMSGFPWFVTSTPTGAELWWDAHDAMSMSGPLLTIVDDGAAEPVGEAVGELAVSPAGRWAVTLPDANLTDGPSFALLDLSTGARSVRAVGADGRQCQVVGWLDDEALLMWCWDGSVGDAWQTAAGPSLWRWGITTDQPAVHLQDLAAGDPYPQAWTGAWVRDGVLAFGAGTVDAFECWTGAYTWGGGTFSLVQGPGALGEDQFHTWSPGGGEVYVQARGGCSGDHVPTTVTAHRDGSSALVAPLPSTTAEVPAWVEGVYSWVVGTAG